jgi:hypothetical protein
LFNFSIVFSNFYFSNSVSPNSSNSFPIIFIFDQIHSKFRKNALLFPIPILALPFHCFPLPNPLFGQWAGPDAPNGLDVMDKILLRN